MRYTRLLAALLVAMGATWCLAETPDWSQNQLQNQPQAMSILQRTRLLNGPNWWSRYGEPVNAEALAQVDASPSDKGVGMVPPPSVYGDGYIFGPGSCDCPPPCIWGLWTGYYQNPLRCHPGHWLHRHGGACGDGCGNCGNGGGLFGSRCGKGCGTAVGCGTPVTCTTAAPSCGAKPVCCGKCRSCHLGHQWRGFMAHWNCGCNSCSTALGCGCATPVGCGCSTPLDMGLMSEKQASQGPPTPLPEDSAVYPLRRLK